MSPSGDIVPQYNAPADNLNLLYQRHRSRIQEYQNFQPRTHGPQHHDVDRREAYGEKLTRIYPRELKRSSGAATRYPLSSSPHPITSPLLSALGSTTNSAAQYTSDWTKSLPFFASPQPGSAAGSPPNAIPVQSRRDAMSTSPPTLKPRSQPNNGFSGLSPLTQNSHLSRDRRASMFSQYGNSMTYRGRAPLPHEDQPHFHPGGLPDFDSIGMPVARHQDHDTAKLVAGEKGYYCGWDTLSTSGHGPSARAENVLLSAYEGGLEVWKVNKKALDKIGCLEGLRGAVIGAKILPWTNRKDPGLEGRPYIALIIHGPVLEDCGEAQNSSDESPAISTEEGSPEPSIRPSSSKGLNIRDVIKQYQTTVEIYSLLNQRHIVTLFATPLVQVDIPLIGDFKVPPPIGGLRVDANGKFVVVASGVSGEVFLFSPFTKQRGVKDLETMRCVGKLWTAVRHREARKPASSTGSPEPSSPIDDAETQGGIPLFSLSNRWIATVPPSSSSLYSINGTALLLESSRKPAGLNTHMAPPQPMTSCAIDTPEGSDFMNRMSRELTQNAIKSSKWLAEQGFRVWENYWKPNTSPANGASYRSTEPQQPQQYFPPTHGYNSSIPSPTHDSTHVSVFDMQRFLDAEDTKVKNVLVPLATFELASGCSFLSFSPSGLHMLTVSRKGDEQIIWSLMKMRDPRSTVQSAPSPGPYVRQINKITRMTTATVVDVAWSAPYGERLSVFTDHGTIHVHEIPGTAFQWPPLRRARRVKQAQKAQSEDPHSPKGPLSSAMSAVNGAGAWLRNTRERSRSGQIFVGPIAMSPANLSRNAVKVGVRQGVNAVTNAALKVYHDGDNKLRLSSKIDVAQSNSMRWMTGPLRGSFAVAAAGMIHIYPVKTTTTSRQGGPSKIRVKISQKGIPFDIPMIKADKFAPTIVATIEARANGTPNTGEIPRINDFWAMRAPHSSIRHRRREKENWHAMVEAETNPPYQPFHTDRRISLYAFPEPATAPPRAPDNGSSAQDFEQYDIERYAYMDEILLPHVKEAHHINDDGQWLFGMDLKNVRTIREGSGRSSDDPDAYGEEMENQVEMQGGQLVVTTIRRQGREEQDFFEDGAEFVDFADDRP